MLAAVQKGDAQQLVELMRKDPGFNVTTTTTTDSASFLSMFLVVVRVDHVGHAGCRCDWRCSEIG